ncbi:Nitrate/nitrite sensor protein NarX [Corynebacterium felinum]|nr:Nitrate/nitrite sensor protein NarX [Corynebacterium felinum]
MKGMRVPTAAYPAYRRHRPGSFIGGVCTGLSLHLGVEVAWVRVALVLASFFGGFGVWFYVAVWVLTKTQDGDVEILDRFPKTLSWVLVGVAVIGSSAVSFRVSSVPAGLAIALVVIAFGSVVTWFAYDRFTSKSSALVIVIGALFVLGGVFMGAIQWTNGQQFSAAVGSVLLTLAGVAALVVPFGLRLLQRLSTQREEKLIAEQRAEIAARLHDSVLQTLALIQKRADNPEEVSRLARGQERELRQWLFAPQEDSTVFAALSRACGEVEDTFGVRIAPVTVGEDQPLTENTQACVLAAREAMVNAAKHSGCPDIDVYAETFDGLRIYVRDRGPGFDLEAVPQDRHGVRDSIFARVKRAGGEVAIHSDKGTEVEIVLASN